MTDNPLGLPAKAAADALPGEAECIVLLANRLTITDAGCGSCGCWHRHRPGAYCCGCTDPLPTVEYDERGVLDCLRSAEEYHHGDPGPRLFLVDWTGSQYGASTLRPRKPPPGDPVTVLYWMVDNVEPRHRDLATGELVACAYRYELRDVVCGKTWEHVVGTDQEKRSYVISRLGGQLMASAAYPLGFAPADDTMQAVTDPLHALTVAFPKAVA